MWSRPGGSRSKQIERRVGARKGNSVAKVTPLPTRLGMAGRLLRQLPADPCNPTRNQKRLLGESLAESWVALAGYKGGCYKAALRFGTVG